MTMHPQSPSESAKPTGSMLARLGGLSAVEEFFDCLGVPYDAAVLAPNRLHILKRMGEMLSAVDLPGLSGIELHARAHAARAGAYEDLPSRGALGARVFRVLKDHNPARPEDAKGRPFVSFDDLLRQSVMNGTIGSDTACRKPDVPA